MEGVGKWKMATIERSKRKRGKERKERKEYRGKRGKRNSIAIFPYGKWQMAFYLERPLLLSCLCPVINFRTETETR
jgi:hypothetical protein